MSVHSSRDLDSILEILDPSSAFPTLSNYSPTIETVVDMMSQITPELLGVWAFIYGLVIALIIFLRIWTQPKIKTLLDVSVTLMMPNVPAYWSRIKKQILKVVWPEDAAPEQHAVEFISLSNIVDGQQGIPTIDGHRCTRLKGRAVVWHKLDEIIREGPGQDATDVSVETTEDLCLLCLAKFENKAIVAVLPCNHSYHAICCWDWFARSLHCPVCRQKYGWDLVVEK